MLCLNKLQVLRMDKDELEAKLSLDGDEDSDWMSDDEDEISSGVC